MFKYIHNKRAQSLLEYVILILIIIAAILTMQNYVKRGLQGRFKSAADDIGDQYSQAESANYHRWVNTSSKTTQSNQKGVAKTELRENEVTNTLTEVETNAFGEYWGEDD